MTNCCNVLLHCAIMIAFTTKFTKPKLCDFCHDSQFLTWLLRSHQFSQWVHDLASGTRICAQEHVPFFTLLPTISMILTSYNTGRIAFCLKPKPNPQYVMLIPVQVISVLGKYIHQTIRIMLTFRQTI